MKSESADLLIGKVLGGAYKITRLIGRGGMGSVYEAHHVRLPRRYAIKLLRGGHTDEAFKRFQREAEIASSIGNRHIAEVFDFNCLPTGAPYMVMEFLEGENLADRLRQVQWLSPRAALDVCGQVAAGLGAAHKRGVIHRDLKPENIFLCPTEEGDDFVKLLDFGISKIRGAEKTITGDLMMLGTPAYMSPEQARGDVNLVDQRTDVYALGAVMYEALTGRPAFSGESVYAVLTQIASQMPPLMHEVAPALPPAVDSVIRQAMAKEPAERQPSATELWKALKVAFAAPPAHLARTAPYPPPVTPIPPSSARPTRTSQGPIVVLTPAGKPHADDDEPTVAVPETPVQPAQEPAPEASTESVPAPFALSRQVAIGIGAVLGSLIVLGSYVVMRPRAQLRPAATIHRSTAASPTATPPPAPPPATTPAPAPAPTPPPPEPDTVHIRLDVTPPDAQLELDGKPVEGAELVLPRSSEKHRLVVSADGYASKRVPIVAGADRTVHIRLNPTPRPPAPAPPASKKQHPSSLMGGSDL